MARKDYHNGNSGKIPPQCGCEQKVPWINTKFGHREPRIVDRGIGLTAYQIEQQVERQRLIQLRSRT